MARLSHSDQQSSATMSGIFAIGCPPERRGPRNAERWQDLRPMHDSRDLDAKGGASLARFARYVSEIARLHPETDTWDEDPASYSAKSMHFAQTLPGRPPFACNRRKEDTWRANLATAAKATSKIDTTNQ